jgi:hypothetical protein
MTAQLQQAIQIAQSLSLSEQLELLQALSDIIQQTHLQETESQPVEDDISLFRHSRQRKSVLLRSHSAWEWLLETGSSG